MIKKLVKHPYLTAFLLNFVIGLIALGWIILTNKGLFTLAGDFNSQQLNFAEYGNYAVKNGLFGWDFALDLGSSFIGGMSFYILGNPSFWVSLLFPGSAFIYVVGWLYILKYAFAGLTSFAYLRTITKTDGAALIGSMLYAFSGFSAEALLFYHFHDVVYLFPLLLLTLDGLMQKKRRGPFAVAVLFNAIVSYYFFFGELIFLLIYFLVRYGSRDIKDMLTKAGQALVEGVLGGGIGLALLLPSALFVIQNPRVSNDYYLSNSLVYSTERYLFILKGILFPGEVMSNHSAVIQKNFSTCSVYLPLVGMVLVLVFFFHSAFNKHWLKKILTICFVFALVPILNASFGMFAGLYCRWYYMMILMMAGATGLVIERWQVEEKVFSSPSRIHLLTGKAALIWSVVLIAFVLLVALVPWNNKGESKLFTAELFVLWFAISLLGAILTWATIYFVKKRGVLILGLWVAVFAALTTMANAYLLRSVSTDSTQEVYERITLSDQLDLEEPGYRYTNKDNFELLRQGLKGTGSFCSTVSGSIFRLYQSLDLKRDVKSPDAPAGLNQLLSSRYTFTNEPRDGQVAIKTLQGDAVTYYVYENTEVPSIGFTYNSYITASEFKELPTADKAPAMLQALVIPDEAENEVSSILIHSNTQDLVYPSDEMRWEGIHRWSTLRQSQQVQNYGENKFGFTSSLRVDVPCYAFFSIPNDEGWTCRINGVERPILDINGLMAVPVTEGDNQIVFHYTTPGLKAGVGLSVLCGILLVVYLIVFRKKKNEG